MQNTPARPNEDHPNAGPTEKRPQLTADVNHDTLDTSANMPYKLCAYIDLSRDSERIRIA